MRICENCRKKKGIQRGLSQVHGTCEFCGKRALCYDIHHSLIPTESESTSYFTPSTTYDFFSASNSDTSSYSTDSSSSDSFSGGSSDSGSGSGGDW